MKAKDERMVGYEKRHFFVRYRALESWVQLDQLAPRSRRETRLIGTAGDCTRTVHPRGGTSLTALATMRYDSALSEALVDNGESLHQCPCSGIVPRWLGGSDNPRPAHTRRHVGGL